MTRLRLFCQDRGSFKLHLQLQTEVKRIRISDVRTMATKPPVEYDLIVRKGFDNTVSPIYRLAPELCVIASVAA